MPGGRNKLEEFAEIVLRYGKNLTAHRDWDTLWRESILDSFFGWQTFAKWYSGPIRVVVDVGSGAGFPGMVIAIVCPDITVHLVDSRKKVVSFLELAAVKLELDNVKIHWSPFQKLAIQNVDVLTSRAVAPLSELCEIVTTSPTDWRIAAFWKGPAWKRESEKMSGCRVISAREYNVPGSDKQRLIVMVERNG